MGDIKIADRKNLYKVIEIGSMMPDIFCETINEPATRKVASMINKCDVRVLKEILFFEY